MSRHQNPEPHDHDDPNFRAALAMFIGLCAAALLLRWAINDGASILGWEILRKITLGELAVAILTLCYVVVASFQWDAMRRMLRITRESNALTLRAWAAVDGWEFKLAPDATTTLRIALENVGRLPVVDGVAGSYTQILEEGETVKWPVSTPRTDDSIHFIIGAGRKTTINFDVLPISKHDVEAVEAGRKAMIIAATFIYTDALGTHGLTTLALTYLPDQHRFTYGPKGNTIE